MESQSEQEEHQLKGKEKRDEKQKMSAEEVGGECQCVCKRVSMCV